MKRGQLPAAVALSSVEAAAVEAVIHLGARYIIIASPLFRHNAAVPFVLVYAARPRISVAARAPICI